MKKSILALSLVLVGHLAAAPIKDNTVKVEQGLLQGTLETSGVRSFKGIPFAQPPVGDLRWQPPQPAQPWTGIRMATKFGARPMAGPHAGDTTIRSDSMSEDCLFLNVWTPAQTTKDRLPVLVWFYGGGFQNGDSSEVRYDGESMAQRGVVTITINYRLGVFGFFAYPGLTDESPHHASGNYGLLDQNEALKWVQRNIAAFGGDPKRVTIAGQSAGSISVCAQMASPLSKKLFSQAMGESGSVLGTLTPAPLKSAEQTGLKFANDAGYHSLAELRAAGADDLLKAAASVKDLRFPLAVDGYFFRTNPFITFQQGKQARVPLLVGWNSLEGFYQGLLKTNPPTMENFEAVVKNLYTNDAPVILKAYAPADDDQKSVMQAAAELNADRFIAYSTWKWSDMQSLTGKPVYRYSFAWARPPLRSALKKAGNDAADLPPRSRNAGHSAEIEYAWGNLDKANAWAWTPDDFKVSQAMESYFANFIKTGNPNGPGLPQWPAITPNQPAIYMRLDTAPGVETEKHRDRYLLIDQLRARQ